MWISSIKSVEPLSLILLLDTSASTNQERKNLLVEKPLPINCFGFASGSQKLES